MYTQPTSLRSFCATDSDWLYLSFQEAVSSCCNYAMCVYMYMYM